MLSGVPKEERRVARALVSLAHMPLLHIGAKIDGVSGRISDAKPSKELTKRTLTLDLREKNTELIKRSFLEVQPLTASLVKTPEYDSHLIRVKATAFAPEVYIPCSVLFLFFWGISSSLVDAVTTEKLLSPERYLYNPNNTDLNSDPIRFEVRRRWTDTEATYLIALLKEPGALQAGERVFKRIAGARMRNPTEPLPLEVWPPFAKQLSISGLFRPMRNALQLTHITSIDLQQNWDALELFREGGRRARTLATDEEKEEEEKTDRPEPKKIGASIAPTDDVDLLEAPGGYGQGAAEIPAVASLRTRFPFLNRITLNKSIDSSNPIEQKSRRQRKPNQGPWTAINGTPVLKKKAIKGKIVGYEDFEPISASEVEVSKVPAPLDPQLQRFADLLTCPIQELLTNGVRLSIGLDFWNPYRALGESYEPIFFDLPTTLGGEELTWLYRDPECQQTKRGLCVRITTDDGSGKQQIRFIIDLERRIPLSRRVGQSAGPISSGVLVIWFDKKKSTLDTCIDLTIVLADAARTRSPAIRIRPFPGVHIATIRHYDTALTQTLSNAISVNDQCVM